MLGSSRHSLLALQASVDGRRAEPGFSGVSADLLAVVRVLGEEKALRLALADAGQPAQVRAGIASTLFSSRITAISMSVLSDIVSARWSSDSDLIEAIEQLGAQVAFADAESNGTLDRIEDELFTFGRAVDQSPELQLALTDPAVGPGRKAELVRSIVEPTGSPATTALVTHLAANLRGRRPATAVEHLARLASAQRHQVLAEVRSAVSLTPDQNTRLVAALAALQGRQVRLNVIVDPSVLGGIVVRIGDDVIDGSVASRLEQARRTVSA